MLDIKRIELTEYTNNGVNIADGPIRSNMLKEGAFCAKDYSEMKEIHKELVERGILKPVVMDNGEVMRIPSGYVNIAVCELGEAGKALVS